MHDPFEIKLTNVAFADAQPPALISLRQAANCPAHTLLQASEAAPEGPEDNAGWQLACHAHVAFDVLAIVHVVLAASTVGHGDIDV